MIGGQAPALEACPGTIDSVYDDTHKTRALQSTHSAHCICISASIWELQEQALIYTHVPVSQDRDSGRVVSPGERMP